MLHDTLDGVLIEGDEDGFHLILSGMKNEYRFGLPQDVALELMRAAKREIEPWWMEAIRARAQEGSGFPELDDYPPADPKSKGYHERMVDTADSDTKRFS